MVAAIDVARYLIHLASPAGDEEADSLTHWQLQKLLYYAQGWHLAARGRPLFEGHIEAWANGPVVREVFSIFRGRFTLSPEEGDAPPSLSAQDKSFLKSVWGAYRKHSASALADKTHKEAPWLAARGDTPPGARSEVEITHESLRAFFQPRLASLIPSDDLRIDKSAWIQSAADIAAGRVRTAQEARSGVQRNSL